MKIWILNVGENMPTDGENTRLLRCGILAEHLSERGHEVIWWSSTFDHYLKKHRFNRDKDIILKHNYKIKYLFGKGYKSNVSFRRIIDHYILGEKFFKYALKEEKPDIIISSYPIISMSYKAIKYSLKNNIPIVIDARDMWPDIFIKEFPRGFKYMANLFLKPVNNKSNYIFQKATAITGMTQSFVEWGLNKSKREIGKFDIAFPFGYEKKVIDQNYLQNEYEFLNRNNINKNKFNIVIISYIGSVLDIDLIVLLAEKIHNNKIDCDILVCGDGVLFDSFKDKIKGIDNIKLLGWCNANEIAIVMKNSSAGFIPYKNRDDFNMSIPNKVPEYMSAGLPVFTSLSGVVKDLVEKNSCGYFIKDADEFISVLKNIIENPSINNIKSENAQSYFNENFDSKVVYSKMCDYLENIVINKKNI